MKQRSKLFSCYWPVVQFAATLAAVCFPVAPICRADLIQDVSSNTSVAVAEGSTLNVSFGTWTYASNNAGYSPDPLNLQIQAYAQIPTGNASYIPGTNSQYYSGYLFSGYLESTDGSVIARLDDSSADRLGLAAGSIVLKPGMVAGQQIAVLSANLALTQSAAAALFGNGATSAWTADAVLVLTNEGDPVTFAMPGASSVRSAFGEPSLSGAGPVQTGGITLQVTLDQPAGVSQQSTIGQQVTLGQAAPSSIVSSVPEPGSAALILVALASGGAFMSRNRSKKS
jgi:hypothetical protein